MSKPTDSALAEKQFFNSLVDESGDFNPFHDEGWNTLKKCFAKARAHFIAPPIVAQQLLDIGCGTGESKKIYDDSYVSYTGIDLSESAIRKASEKYPADFWRVADACSLPFEDESFDVVAFSSLLHHIPNYGQAVKEGFRVLRRGGIAFAFDPNLLHPAMALLRHPKSPLYLSAGVSPNERPLLASSLRREFYTSGFSSVYQWCQSNIPYRRVAPRAVNLFLTAYNTADWFWEKLMFGRVFGTFVITSAFKS